MTGVDTGKREWQIRCTVAFCKSHVITHGQDDRGKRRCLLVARGERIQSIQGIQQCSAMRVCALAADIGCAFHLNSYFYASEELRAPRQAVFLLRSKIRSA